MAGFVKIGNHEYLGTIKLAESVTDGVENGSFVVVNFSLGTATPCTVNTAGAYFVENEIDTVEEDYLNGNNLDYIVKPGKYLKLKKLIPMNVFVTTKIAATAPVVGDIVDVGTTGVITKTAGTPAQTFTVIEIPTLWGKTAYTCITN
jgi:threonine dehydrogenase-like Zn-dependent dehydrogenase